ncbi:DciA family protein [Streptomyces sp. t39]|uniref:DciA family protein n=1 Tax=Streptomyces sp. t39 TaxID=1828156 RepID=UPI0016508982|nr:DciA family protein [Streptomyces sp. t39]
MTEQTTQPVTGADLARQALNGYKAGRTPGTGRAPRKKTGSTRTDRTGGRDPQPFAAILGRMATEQGWNTNLQGGNILDRFDELCPQYAGKVQALEFREDTGMLILRPSSDVWAAQLRLLGDQLRKQINTKLGSEVVRELGLARVGNLDTKPPEHTRAPQEAPAATTPPAAPNPYYLETLAVARAHRPDRTDHLAPAVRDAVRAQDEALRANREPDDAFTEAAAQQELLERKAGPQADSPEAIRLAAIARKYAGDREPRRLFAAS